MTFGVAVLTDGDRINRVTEANIAAIEIPFRRAFPDGKVTWCLDDRAITDPDLAWLRSLIADRVDTYGDLAAYWHTYGFPGAGNPTPTLIDIYDERVPALATATGSPPAIAAWGALSADLLGHLHDTYGISAAFGQVWSQASVDGFSGAGGVDCPYYPSATNAAAPAVTPDDHVPVLLLDCDTQELFAAQLTGTGSRISLHPVDSGPPGSLSNMQGITDARLADPNPINTLASLAEVDWLADPASNSWADGEPVARDTLAAYWAWLASEHPGVRCVTTDEAGAIWAHRYPENTWQVFHAQDDFRGPTDRTIYWRHTPTHRVALLRDGDDVSLLDLTRYGRTPEPNAPDTDWTHPSIVDQKGTSHPANPYLVASCAEVWPLLDAFPDLTR